MTPDEQILQLLREWSPEVVRLLDQAGYWDLPRNSTKRAEIAKKIGLVPGGKTYDRVLKAALEKNENISQIVLNEYSLREFKAGAREVAKQLNIPFSKYDWNDGAQEHFEKHGLRLVKQMSQTDLDSLRDRIQYDFNLDPKAFAKKYAESYSCSPARLERIKRTEAHTEGQAGGYNFAQQAGATEKTWNCHPRGKWPRATHRAVWHETVPMDKPFSNGLMWPSEPNCRCYLTYGFGSTTAKPGKSSRPTKDASPEEFIKQRDKLPKDKKPFLTLYTANEYKTAGVKLKLHESGNGGYGLKGDELISVFSLPGNHLGYQLVEDAKANGARRLDCLGKKLVSTYKRNGFEVVKIDKWDDRYAPKDWDYAEHGKPDIYYMELKE